jgi:hypothetical protein
MSLLNLTAAQLKHAADIIETIEKLNLELAAILGSQNEPAEPAVAPVKRGRKKGGMSAAGRKAVAAAQKARWAKVKSAKAESTPVEKLVAAEKPAKRKMSAAGRKAIAAAQKARWAKVKAQGKA